VGRDDPQDATALFDVIKERISTSSHAIFDATRGNPNVSLEYGYAEGIRASRSIYLSGHKAARRTAASGPIISDLSGMRRVQYNTVKMLSIELHRFCKGHEYTQRFESALTRTLRGETGGAKKRGRTLALKLIHTLDGLEHVQRRRLVEHVEAQNYSRQEIETMIAGLRAAGILHCGRAAISFATINGPRAPRQFR